MSNLIIYKFLENINDDAKATKGPQEGEFSIVSIENRPWIAAGVVALAKVNEIQISLERYGYKDVMDVRLIVYF